MGLTAWPSGELRLEGVEHVTDSKDADIFICPGPLCTAHTYGLDRLPFMKGNEARHVFLDVSDYFTKPIGKPCMFIRCNMRTWMSEKDPGSISCAWPVEDYSECLDIPQDGFTYDISFHGWLSADTRIKSSRACKRNPGLVSDIATYTDFTGYIYNEPEGIRRRAAFRKSMQKSRLALCPESISGVFPYRFFEAMSAGRVPLLVGSDFVFPFADEIPYSDFILQCSRENAAHADTVAVDFLAKTSDAELIEKGKQARAYWERFLDARLWPKLHAYAVSKKMSAMGLLSETPVHV